MSCLLTSVSMQQSESCSSPRLGWLGCVLICVHVFKCMFVKGFFFFLHEQTLGDRGQD